MSEDREDSGVGGLAAVDAWAPGRVNLIGEHTDHTDGLALPMALDVGVHVTGEGGGDRIRLTSDAAPEPVDLAADGRGEPQGWGRYVAAVATELAALGRPPVGLEAQVRSTLPQGIGLSSSAALEVAVAVALLQAAGWSLDALELVRACRRAEHRAVGVPSGVLDQSASVLCTAGHALLLDCADLSTRPVALPAGLSVVVVDSGVRRSLEGSGYAQRTEELRAALPVLDGRRPADVEPSELADLLADLPDVPARRLRHVVTENHRVRAATTALEAGDQAAIASLFEASHRSLREDFEVTVPETDLLVELLVEHGAVAARMTGGGFGGAVVGLVRDGADEVADAAAADYARRMPGRTPQVLVTVAGDGAAARAPELVRR